MLRMFRGDVWLLLVLCCYYGCQVHGGDQCSWLPDNESSPSSSKFIVSCNIRSWDKHGSANLSVLPAEVTSKLHIKCTPDIDFTETTIHIQRLPHLEELHVHHCKWLTLDHTTLNRFPSLKKLIINTYDAEWGPSKMLELFDPTLFNANLQDLQQLDLGHNNMRSLPDGIFCDLPNLQTLNLTQNRLRTMIDFAAPSCISSSFELINLDMSHNRLSGSFEHSPGLSRLRRLQLINLSSNNITDMTGESLAGLFSLRVLNLANNRLEILPQELFAGCKELREIHLQNNSIGVLPKGLFHRLEQLIVLDLSGNQLTSTHIDSSTFTGLIRLIVLNLAHNALTRIDSRTFKDLFFLQILDLRNNSIGFIEDNAFLPLYNLHTLNLAENRLNTIGPLLFNGLFVLSKLTINNNLIVNIEPAAFRNCSALKELDLSSNALEFVPDAIQELTFLRTLDLGENQISDFRNGSFKNLNQLTGLRLIDNNIGNLSRGMLWDLPSLQVLNLAKNKIQNIERGTFERNTQLEAIRLDENFLSDINGIFATLATLLWLNLSDNHLVWFDYAFIPSNLKWLDIHGNFIEHLGNYYKIQDEIRVKTLDASHNRITELSPMSIPNSIELLFINNNFVKTVHPNTFVDKSALVRIDMYANELQNIELGALRVAPVPNGRSLPEIYLGGNPFQCDCHMDWLHPANNITSSVRQYPRVMDIDNIVCKMTHSRVGTDDKVPLSQANPQDFLCTYETHCFALCHCCDFDACDCEMTCPTNCSCYHDQTWNTNVVDCSRQGRSHIPSRIPMDTTELYLDGNDLEELQHHVFIGRKNMRVLFMNASNIFVIPNSSFTGLYNLQILHLEDNRIGQLEGYEFQHLSNLNELYLQNNLIQFIANTTLAPLHSLRVLQLHGNRLSALPVWQMSLNKPYLYSMTLAENRWNCDCEFLEPFTAWLVDNAARVEDSAEIECYHAAMHQRHLIDLNSTVACTDLIYSGSFLIDSSRWQLTLALLCLLFVFLLIVGVWFVCRQSVRSWLYSRYGVRLCSFHTSGAKSFADDRDDKLYDAYVCYSAKDEEWLMQSLLVDLETKYQLCLHHRDLPPTTYALVEACESSRRIILILTRNLVQNEWLRYELRHALRDVLSGRPYKLVIIELEELAPYEDTDLRSLLRNGQRLRWGEKRFWSKLQYCMPPGQDAAHKTMTNSTQYRRNINNYTIDSRGASSNAVLMPNGSSAHMMMSPPPHVAVTATAPLPPSDKGAPPPAYSATAVHELVMDDTNYSSATTATPSPRPARRGGAATGQEPVAASMHGRPLSDHIYSSIDSDYSTLERGGGAASTRRAAGPPWRHALPQAPHVVLQSGMGGGHAYLV